MSRISTNSAQSNQSSYRQPVRLRDSSSSSKPTGAITIDGVAPNYYDRVLFTNLSGLEASDNNKVFRAIVVSGNVTGWNLDVDGRYPDGEPRDGDTLYVQEGTTDGDKVFNYTGTGWVMYTGGGGGPGAYVLKTGDTMTGALSLPSQGLSIGANQFFFVGNSINIGVVLSIVPNAFGSAYNSWTIPGQETTYAGIDNTGLANLHPNEFLLLSSANPINFYAQSTQAMRLQNDRIINYQHTFIQNNKGLYLGSGGDSSNGLKGELGWVPETPFDYDFYGQPSPAVSLRAERVGGGGAPHDLVFFTTSQPPGHPNISERMRLTSTGRLLIGTSSFPGAKLVVHEPNSADNTAFVRGLTGSDAGVVIKPLTLAETQALRGSATTPATRIQGTNGNFTGVGDLEINIEGGETFIGGPLNNVIIQHPVALDMNIYSTNPYIYLEDTGGGSQWIQMYASNGTGQFAGSISANNWIESDGDAIFIATGNNSDIAMQSGAGGSSYVQTSNNTSGNSGGVYLKTGTATGTRGSLFFDEVSLATAANGYIWTLQDATTGRGAWAAAPSGSSASGVSGAIQFSAGGGTFSSDAPNLFWDNPNNRLGINTNAPAQPLEVNGPTSSLQSGIALFKHSNDTQGVNIGYGGISKYTTNGSNDLYIDGAVSTSGNVILVANSTGNVGIGGTPTDRLHVRRTGDGIGARFQTNSGSGVWLNFTDGFSYNNLIGVENAAGNAVFGSGLGRSLALGTDGPYAVTIHAQAGARMTILPSGNIGIATTNPLYRLHVVVPDGTNYAFHGQMSSGELILRLDANANAAVMGVISSGRVYFGSQNPTTVEIRTNNVERWRWDTSGNFFPLVNNSYDIGTLSSQFVRNVYIGTGLSVGTSQQLNLNLNTTIWTGEVFSSVVRTAAGFGLAVYSGDTSSGSQNVFFGTGANSGTSGGTGRIRLWTGNVTNAGAAGSSGDVHIKSGDNSGTAAGRNSGNIIIETGTVVGGTRGNIRLVDASLAGASNGWVWTLQDNTTGRGAWAAAGGGGGTPGGTDTAVQFNNAGAFGGDATNFFWNNTTKALTIGTTSTNASRLNLLTGNGQVMATTSAATVQHFWTLNNTTTNAIIGLESSTGTGIFGSGFTAPLVIGTVTNSNIVFGVNNANRVVMTSGRFYPFTSDGMDLGNGLNQRWGNVYANLYWSYDGTNGFAIRPTITVNAGGDTTNGSLPFVGTRTVIYTLGNIGANDLSISTLNSSAQASASIYISSGSGLSGQASGSLNLQTGLSNGAGSTGAILIASGNSSSTGNSGSITIQTGTSSLGARGTITLSAVTYNIAGTNQNFKIIPTSNNAVKIGDTGNQFYSSLILFTQSQNTLDANVLTVMSGNLFALISGGGQGIGGFGTGTTYPLTMITQTSTSNDAVQTLDIRLITGNKTAGTGNSGSITLQTGTSAGGTRGKIVLDALSARMPTVAADPAAPVNGDIWYNTTTNQLKAYVNGATVVLA